MKTNHLFEQLIEKKSLSQEQMQDFMQACMTGELSSVQIATFLALMRAKGETVAELTTAARVMMDFAHCIDLGDDLIDIVGTGGDGKNTFNISTITSFVVAATGTRVAKHGNRSVSGRSGSADLLMHAGFELQLSDEQLQECMRTCQLSFLFAPHFHPAMQQVRDARQALGIRTFFNLLGPLVNPARVKKQVVGVFANHWQRPLAKVLVNLGSERALVVSSRDGMDEVSISALTDVVEYDQGQYKQWAIDPKEFNCFHSSLDGIIVSSPAESLDLAKKVLAGNEGPARDIVLLNAALALHCANNDLSLSQAIEKAKDAIDSGKAAECFKQLQQLTIRPLDK